MIKTSAQRQLNVLEAHQAFGKPLPVSLRFFFEVWKTPARRVSMTLSTPERRKLAAGSEGVNCIRVVGCLLRVLRVTCADEDDRATTTG
jgi:hypothetical protein